MIDLRKYYLDNVNKDEYYYLFYKQVKDVNITYNVFEDYKIPHETGNATFYVFDTEEAITKFRELCQPQNGTCDSESICWFYVIGFYLDRQGYYIEQFPNVLHQPPRTPDKFTYDEIRNYAFSKGQNIGNAVPYKARRKIVSEMKFEKFAEDKKNMNNTIKSDDTRKHMLFISHSSEDKDYCDALVTLLQAIGMNEGNMICSSIPGYGVPLDEDIYQWLASQFNKIELHVVFMLSNNYYNSAACLNEMGAAWVLRDKYTSILLPGFEFNDIKGACNPNQISIKLDSDETELKQRLNELKDNLTNEFDLNRISDIRWEGERDNYIKTIKNTKPQVK